MSGKQHCDPSRIFEQLDVSAASSKVRHHRKLLILVTISASLFLLARYVLLSDATDENG